MNNAGVQSFLMNGTLGLNADTINSKFFYFFFLIRNKWAAAQFGFHKTNQKTEKSTKNEQYLFDSLLKATKKLADGGSSWGQLMSPPLCPISRGGGERVGVKEDNCSPVYRYEALPLVGSSHKDKGRGRGGI